MGGAVLLFHQVQVGANVGTGPAQQHISVPWQTQAYLAFFTRRSPYTADESNGFARDVYRLDGQNLVKLT